MNPTNPFLAIASLILISLMPLQAADNSYSTAGVTYYHPASIKTSQLSHFTELPEARQQLIATALDTVSANPWLKYKFGSSTPSAGGFDCSGAMYYVLKKAGYNPPRSSAQQYIWIRDAGKITNITGQPQSLDDKVFEKLTPGDLIFWSGTYNPTDGRTVKISHVSLYLGKEKDGRYVMIGATKGRSYRGKKGDGYGVYDFHLPRKSSKSRFIGFGPPPGLESKK